MQYRAMTLTTSRKLRKILENMLWKFPSILPSLPTFFATPLEQMTLCMGTWSLLTIRSLNVLFSQYGRLSHVITLPNNWHLIRNKANLGAIRASMWLSARSVTLFKRCHLFHPLFWDLNHNSNYRYNYSNQRITGIEELQSRSRIQKSGRN